MFHSPILGGTQPPYPTEIAPEMIRGGLLACDVSPVAKRIHTLHMYCEGESFHFRPRM